MDVIGRDVLPTDTKASSATKLTNGNATLSEDNAATVAAGAGRKKTKRKSKAKNSHREDAESELKIEAPSARATAAEKLSAASVTLPKVATTMVATTESGERANGESVNSNSSRAFGSSSSSSSSSHRSSHSNGLPADDAPPPVDTSVDEISQKLEQCVQISRNGLTNGLPKHEEVGSGTVDGTITTTTSGKEPSTGKASKKKHRSSQAKKAQPTKTICTVNGIGEHGDDGVEEQEQKSVEPTRKSQQTASALPGSDSLEDKEFVGSQSGSDNMKKLDADNSVIPTTESCSRTGSDGPSPASSAPISSISLPTSTSNDAGSEETSKDSAENQRAPVQITYQVYESERQMPAIMSLIQKDLSEPYSIYTYRYFIHNWPKLCFLALHEDTCVGAIVCKLDIHRQDTRRGYIAMLAVDKDYRKLKIGTTLVQKAIQVMVEDNADEVVLETEITNQPALRLYENLGFVRDKRLFHYYLNGVDALRLKLWFR